MIEQFQRRCNVTQRVKVVFRDSTLAPRLHVGQLNNVESNLADHSTKVRIGIVDLTNDFNDFTVVKAEAGKILDKLDVRSGPDKAAIEATKCKEQRGFFRFGFYANHDRCARELTLDKRSRQLR